MKNYQLNSITLTEELAWLSEIIKTRFDLYFGKETKHTGIYEILPPNISEDKSVYASFINHYNLNFIERLAVILTLVPHVQPQLLDVFYTKNSNYQRGFTEFGGVKGESFGGFLPTGETLSFIAGGKNLQVKFNVVKLFEADAIFAKHSIIRLNAVKGNEPFLSGSLEMFNDFVELFTLGKASKPSFNSKFPAKLITTKLDWADFIVENSVMESMNDILLWMKHKDKIMHEWNLKKIIKPGYRTLFHGPPGTAEL